MIGMRKGRSEPTPYSHKEVAMSEFECLCQVRSVSSLMMGAMESTTESQKRAYLIGAMKKNIAVSKVLPQSNHVYCQLHKQLDIQFVWLADKVNEQKDLWSRLQITE